MLELIESKNFAGLQFYIVVRIMIVLVCWIFMIVACIIDFWSGTSTAKELGKPLSSHKFRRTITKMGDYIKLLLFALMFDLLGSLMPFWVIPFASIMCSVAIILIEGKSVIENSRKKKAHAADVPDVIKQIVQAVTTKQGEEVLNKIIESMKQEEQK